MAWFGHNWAISRELSVSKSADMEPNVRFCMKTRRKLPVAEGLAGGRTEHTGRDDM